MRDMSKIKGKNFEILKILFLELNRMVTSVDRVGSGFYDAEDGDNSVKSTALALLLYFDEEKVLDKLAHLRNLISSIIEQELTEEEFDNLCDSNKYRWKPPYGATQKELVDKINRAVDRM